MRKLCLVVTGLWVPSLSIAQGAANDHWRAISRVVTQAHGLASLSRGDISVLTGQLVARARFYEDLHEYEAIVARDQARMREAVGKRGGPSIPAAPYFLGRALQELGKNREALEAYRSVGPAAPESIRIQAAAWSATLMGGGQRTWMQDLVDWRAGRAITRTTCPPTNSGACSLFRAILANDASEVLRLSDSLAAHPDPTYRITIRDQTGTAPVDFFDPVDPYLLSLADYVTLLRVLEGVSGADGPRGVALLRLGRYKDAESALRAASGAAVSAYLGEVLYRTERRQEAEQAWRGTTGGALNLTIDVRTSVIPDSVSVLRQFAAERTADLKRMTKGEAGGIYLARALLRYNAADDAAEVLDYVMPASAGLDLSNVTPDQVLLASRARYVMGASQNMRDNFPLARNGVATLAQDIPVFQRMLNLLQQITAPSNVGDLRPGS